MAKICSSCKPFDLIRKHDMNYVSRGICMMKAIIALLLSMAQIAPISLISDGETGDVIDDDSGEEISTISC